MIENNPIGLNSLGLTDDEYRKLCLRAFENLPSNTAVTIEDVDSILTWCLPKYNEIKQKKLSNEER